MALTTTKNKRPKRPDLRSRKGRKQVRDRSRKTYHRPVEVRRFKVTDSNVASIIIHAMDLFDDPTSKNLVISDILHLDVTRFYD